MATFYTWAELRVKTNRKLSGEGIVIPLSGKTGKSISHIIV